MRKLLLISGILLMAISLSSLSFAATITLQNGLDGYAGMQDTHIEEQSSKQHNDNGASANILIRKKTDQNEHALFYFDISMLPAYDSITSLTSAKLSIYKAEGDQKEYFVQVYRITSGSWQEGDGDKNTNDHADWVHRIHNTASWNSPGAKSDYDISTTATKITSNHTWYEWDVTDILKSWWSGTNANYGFLLMGYGDEGERHLESSESATPPKLTVEYVPKDTPPPEPQVPEPASAVLLSIGLLGLIGRKMRNTRKRGGSMKKLLVVLGLIGLLAGNAWAVPSVASIDGLIGAGEWDGYLFHVTDGDEAGAGIGNIPNAYDISDVYVYQGATEIFFRIDTFSTPLPTNGGADVYIKAFLDYDNDSVFEDSVYVNYLGQMEVMTKNGGYHLTTGIADVDDIWEFCVPNSFLSGSLSSGSSWYVLLDNGGDNADDRVPDRSNPVPEPASMSLLGISLLGLAGIKARRK